MGTRYRNILFYFAPLCALTIGCGGPQYAEPAPSEQRSTAAAKTAGAAVYEEENYAAGSQKIDLAPVSATKPKIVSTKDSLSQDTPVCIYTIRYPGHPDHEIAWRRNRCDELSASFLMRSDLERLGKIERLDKETLFELSEYHKLGVFYIEGEFTASIYPLNVAGVPHEVSVAD